MSLTNMLVRFTQLGAEWVMWLLLALSVVSIAVTIERAWYFLSRRIKFEAFRSQLETLLRSGELKEAQQLTKSSRAPECVVAAAGLAHGRIRCLCADCRTRLGPRIYDLRP